MTRQDEAYKSLSKLSTLNLYVEKFRMQDNLASEEKFMASALIEVRKERRDYWTLVSAAVAAVAAIVAAAAAVIGLFEPH